MFSIQSKGVLDPYSKSFVSGIIPSGVYAERCYLLDKFYVGYFIILSRDPEAINLKVTRSDPQSEIT